MPLRDLGAQTPAYAYPAVQGNEAFPTNWFSFSTEDPEQNFQYVGVLVPDVIVSSQYIEGSDGFKLFADGSAEFNDIVARGTITATSGAIGGFVIDTNVLYSTDEQLYLDPVFDRFTVKSGGQYKVVMGYLDGLAKPDGGTYTTSDYGFWVASGTNLYITGDANYDAGDWVINHDAAYTLVDNSNNELARFGSLNATIFAQGDLGLQVIGASSRLFAGVAAGNYIKWDGTNLSWVGTNTSLTTGGLFTASNANITGAITVTGGNAMIEADVIEQITYASNSVFGARVTGAFYSCDASDGATLTDVSGNEEDVTLTGGYWAKAKDVNGQMISTLRGGKATTYGLDENVQTVATVSFDEWHSQHVAASYQFDGSGADSSINGNDLTENGTPVYGAGPWGLRACTFDGSTDYFSRVAWFAPGADNFSIEIVFKTPAALPSDKVLIQQSDGGATTDAFYIRFDTAGNIDAQISGGAVSVDGAVVASANVLLNSWNHLVVVYNRKTGFAYGFLNGVAQASLNISSVTGAVSAAGTYAIGRISHTAGQFYAGSIAIVQPIYAALSADDVRARYNALTGTLTEETKVYGALDGNQSAAFHGGLNNLVYDQQDLSAWTATAGLTCVEANENYKGYPLYLVTRTAAGGTLYTNTFSYTGTDAVVSWTLKKGTASGCTLWLYNNITGATKSLVVDFTADTVTESTGTWLDSGVTVDSDDSDYIIVWGVVTGMTTHIHRMYIRGIEDSDSEYFWAGMPMLSPTASRIPFNLNATAGTAHNETGIPFYPRDGMVIEWEGQLMDYATSGDGAILDFYISSSNRLIVYYTASSNVLRVGLVIAGVASELRATFTTGIRGKIKLVTTVSVGNPLLTVYYGYNYDTEEYTDTLVDTTWSSASTGAISALAATPLTIGIYGTLTSGQFNGHMKSLTISHPDDPTYYFKREWNLPWGEYVEKPSLLEGVASMRHVRAFKTFQVKKTLDWLQNVPSAGYDQNSLAAAHSALGKTLISGGYINTGLVVADSIVAGTITADKIDVDDLFAQELTLSNTGSIHTTDKDTYADTTAGFWLGYDSTAYKLNIGNSTNYFKWTGSAIDIKGSITASSGTIGGWTIDSNGLKSGTSSDDLYIQSAGKYIRSYAFYSHNFGLYSSDAASSFTGSGYLRYAGSDYESPTSGDSVYGVLTSDRSSALGKYTWDGTSKWVADSYLSINYNDSTSNPEITAWADGTKLLSFTKASCRFSVPFLLTETRPANAAATGVQGTITADTLYIYICTATNTWKRVAISTW